MKTKKIKVLLMGDSGGDIYYDSGLAKLRRSDEPYDIIAREFKTEEEMRAFIEGMYVMAEGCWTDYAIVNNRTQIL